jgi:lysophospholipase L1-like esterase
LLSSSLKNLIKNLTRVAIGSIVFLLVLEVGIRVTYRIRNSRVEYVPIPYMVRNFGVVAPWMDGLRIIEPDDVLLFHGKANAQRKYLDLFCPMPSEQFRKALLRRFSPSIPDEFRNNNTWEVKLNSEGFRNPEFSTPKPLNTVRIVCLGDSWTFGHNADQDKTYPQRLAVLLKESFPKMNIEVLNLGMLASTSHIGLEVLKRRALSLNPDIVLIGYSMNDAYLTGWHDKDVLVPKTHHFSLRKFISENSELYRLMTYLGQARKFESSTMTDHLRASSDPNDQFVYESWVSAEALEAKDYERRESRLRVTPLDYEKNIREMIRLILEHGAIPILLHNELRAGSPYQSALKRISAEEKVALVDNCELLGDAKRQIEKGLEQRLALQPSTGPLGANQVGPVEVVFRLYIEKEPVPRAMYIAGPHPQLGDSVPNKIAMFDDGTHGDQKAGDHVWSVTATFSPGQKIFYVYTNSGEEGQWQNLDLPKVRSFTVPSNEAGRIYRPIETFGKLYLQADGFHTNTAGYELIARAVREAVMQTEKFRSAVNR